MRSKYFYTYIMTNKGKSVLYVGVTSSIYKRSLEHKNKENQQSFTAKYNVNILVYYETFEDVYLAISREKQIKNLLRKKKIDLIDSMNPEWDDLSNSDE